MALLKKRSESATTVAETAKMMGVQPVFLGETLVFFFAPL